MSRHLRAHGRPRTRRPEPVSGSARRWASDRNPRRFPRKPGAVEMSNASAITSMTTLVTASRHFEMLTRVIEAFSTIDYDAAPPPT
ncbi:MAG: flagellar basal body rod C-terminal domain-containing protein [Polyangiaceae bacterium]